MTLTLKTDEWYNAEFPVIVLIRFHSKTRETTWFPSKEQVGTDCDTEAIFINGIYMQ